jgi:Tol biopolymer transport system component
MLLILAIALPLAAQNKLLKAKGEAQRMIFSKAQRFMRPVCSPDGSMIAFTSDRYQGLFIYDIQNGQVRQICDDQAAGFGFSWSPDSKSLLAITAKMDNMRRLNAVKSFDVQSAQPTLLSVFSPIMPTVPQYSADGSRVFFIEQEKIVQIKEKQKALQKPVLVAEEILYTLDQGKLVAIDLSSGNRRKLDPLPGNEYLNLAISPDQSKLAFEVYGGNLFIMNLSNGKISDLGLGNRPAWSADGKYVAYMVAKDDGHVYLESDIWISDSAGGRREPLTGTIDFLEMNPNWSPDGRQIVFDNNLDGSIYILLVEEVTE